MDGRIYENGNVNICYLLEDFRQCLVDREGCIEARSMSELKIQECRIVQQAQT